MNGSNDESQIAHDEDGVVDESGGQLVTIDATTAMALARAEIDQQVATAHAYPRSITRAAKAMLDLVQLDKASADECMYRLPIEGAKAVMGPSIRFAEALKQAWGNCAAGSRVTEINRKEQYVEAEGVFIDYETNTRTTFRTQRSIRGKNGRTYQPRMIVTTASAACSIAMRESILKGIPKMIWRNAYAEVVKTVRGDVQTLVERRGVAVASFAAYGIKPEQIFAALDIGGMEDIGLDEIVELRAMYQAIKNGEATVEEYFSPKTTDAHVVKGALDDIGAGDDAARLRGHTAEQAAAREAPGKSVEGQSAEAQKSPAADPKPSAGAGAAAQAQTADSPPAASVAAASNDKAAAETFVEKTTTAFMPGAQTQTPPEGAAAGQLAVDAPQQAREFSEAELAEADEAGARCFRKGMSKRSNPHKAGEEPLAAAWAGGFDRAKKTEAEGG